MIRVVAYFHRCLCVPRNRFKAVWLGYDTPKTFGAISAVRTAVDECELTIGFAEVLGIYDSYTTPLTYCYMNSANSKKVSLGPA